MYGHGLMGTKKKEEEIKYEMNTMESGDWMAQLPAYSQETNKNEIMGHPAIQDLKLTTESVATSQPPMDLDARLQSNDSKTTLQEQQLIPPRSGSMATNVSTSQLSHLFRLQHPFTMGSSHWRSPPSRNGIITQIVETLKMYLPSIGRHTLRKLAERLEDEVFTAATCQFEYIANIRLNLRTVEDTVHNPTADHPMRSSFVGNRDWQAEVFQQLEASKDPVTGQMMEVTEDLSLLNLMPAQAADGAAAVGDTAVESGDSIAQLPAHSPETNRNQIVETLKMHLRSIGRHTLMKIAERVEEEVFTAATCQSEYINNIRLNLRTMEGMVQNPTADHPMRSSSVGDGDWQAEVYQQLLEALKDQNLRDSRIAQRHSVKEQIMNDLLLLNLILSPGAVGDTAVEPGDWRAQLQTGREINRKEIMRIFTRHLSFLGDERLQELKKTAEMVEERIYTLARSEDEYWLETGLRMLDLKARFQNSLSNGSPMKQEVKNYPLVPIDSQGLYNVTKHPHGQYFFTWNVTLSSLLCPNSIGHK